MRKIIWAGSMAILWVGWSVLAAQANWVLEGSSYCGDGNYSTNSPSLDDSKPSSTPYIAYTQGFSPNSRIMVNYFSTNWQTLFGPLNYFPAYYAITPDLVMNMGYPYVVWSEQNPSMYNVRAAFYNGTNWEAMGSIAINDNASENVVQPRMAIYNGTPYVCYVENSASHDLVFLKAYFAPTWVPLGNQNINGNFDAANPDLSSDNTSLYLAWQEKNAANESKVYAKKYDGATWSALGSTSLNITSNRDATHPKIVGNSGIPYAVWQEDIGSTQTVFAAYCSSNWNPIGTPLNNVPERNAILPDIALDNATPYVTWCESDGNTLQVYAKFFNGTDWEALGGSLNQNPAFGATNPVIKIMNGTPFVSWEEYEGVHTRTYVKYWEWDTYTPTPTGSITPTPTPSLTRTRTSTRTATATRTATSTATQTASVTVTGSSTPAVSQTFTPTPSESSTASQTGTWTATRTASRTMTESPTPRDSATPTPTITPTHAAISSFSVTTTQIATALPTSTTTPWILEPTHTPSITASMIAPNLHTPTTTRTENPGRQPDAGSPIVIRNNILRPGISPNLRISLYLDKSQRVFIRIFTLQGKLVRVLTDRVADAGTFETVWEGLNEGKNMVRSGVYLVFIQTDNFKEKRKVVVVR